MIQRYKVIDGMPRIVTPFYRRLLDKVRIDDNGCWIFVGSRDRTGYGRIQYNGQVIAAHRASHEYYIGAIPEGYEVDHLCVVRSCVNPRHLEAVPPRINMLRSSAPGAVRWKSGYCKRGHPMVEANLYYRKDRPGKTECKTCMLLHNLGRHHSHRPTTVEKYKINEEKINVRL